MSERVTCTNCGFLNEPGDEFCGNCGTYLAWSGTPGTDQASAASGPPPPPPTPADSPPPPQAAPPPPPPPTPADSPPPPQAAPPPRPSAPPTPPPTAATPPPQGYTPPPHRHRRSRDTPRARRWSHHRTRSRTRSCRHRRWAASRVGPAGCPTRPAGPSASAAVSGSIRRWAPWPDRPGRHLRRRQPERRHPGAAATASVSRSSVSPPCSSLRSPEWRSWSAVR